MDKMREISARVRVSMRLALNPCVSRSMPETWQACSYDNQLLHGIQINSFMVYKLDNMCFAKFQK